MTKTRLAMSVSLIALTACAGPARALGPASPAFAPARIVSDRPLAPSAGTVTAALLEESTKPAAPASRPQRQATPLAEVEAANRGAVLEPAPDSYVGAV